MTGTIPANIETKVILDTKLKSTLDSIGAAADDMRDKIARHVGALPEHSLCPPLPGAVTREVAVKMNGVDSFIYMITDYDAQGRPILYTSNVREGADGPVISTHEFNSKDILSRYVELHLAAVKAQGSR